jgi:hypothetical protein
MDWRELLEFILALDLQETSSYMDFRFSKLLTIDYKSFHKIPVVSTLLNIRTAFS